MKRKSTGSNMETLKEYCLNKFNPRKGDYFRSSHSGEVYKLVDIKTVCTTYKKRKLTMYSFKTSKGREPSFCGPYIFLSFDKISKLKGIFYV